MDDMIVKDDKRSLIERKRNILFLIVQYLSDYGLNSSVSAVMKEANLPLNYQLCDNVDLDSMYIDFCSYQKLRLGKVPKIVKKIDQDAGYATVQAVKTKPSQPRPKRLTSSASTEAVVIEGDPLSSVISASSLSLLNKSAVESNGNENLVVNSSIDFLHPLNNHENFSPEWKDMADMILRDVVRKDCKIKWQNVFGNQNAKMALQESVMMPLEHPELFSGLTKPWKGILLHGAPGVGKTYMVKALSSATFGTVVFFNIHSSSIISKWRGESEKFVRVLFDLAKFYAPSIIFIDEFESLASKRDSPTEHEASRRFKNEFLVQIDELDYEKSQVLLLANTNLPWEIDPAFLRRLERKLYIGLPELDDRIEIIKNVLPVASQWNRSVLRELCLSMDGFTGDDIRLTCKEASLKQIRTALKYGNERNNSKIPAVSPSDLMEVAHKIKPSAKYSIGKHQEWSEKFGN